MDDERPVVTAARDGHVLWLTIDRPHRRNAVDTDVAVALGGHLADADTDPEVRVVVLTGSGDVAFCAGADLRALAEGRLPIDPAHPERGFAGVASHPVSTPMIAAVNGLALGGGTELALACDLVVAAQGASFGLPEVRRGLLAGAGGAFRLPRQLPVKLAMEVLLTGEPLSADEAARWGLVNRVVPADRLREETAALAAAVAANAPLAVQASKRLALRLHDGAVADEEASWAATRAELERLGASRDLQEGLAAFAQKRPPVWEGR